MESLGEKLEYYEENCDAYVMCSTLNQVVNYIPLIEILKKQTKKKIHLINLTYSEDENKKTTIKSRFPNLEWDENFKDVLGSIGNEINENIIQFNINKKNAIEFCKKASPKHYVQKLKKVFEDSEFGTISKHNSGYIIWNLTGGQRNMVFAAERFIEQDIGRKHITLYLEGNTQRITIGMYTENQWNYEVLEENYGDSNITLKKVFQLMGYEVNYSESVLFQDQPDEEYMKRIETYYSFWEGYYIKNFDLRKALILTNKESTKEDANKEIKAALEKAKVEEEIKEVICNSLKNKGKLFGYLLEYMTEAVIWKCLENMDPDKKFFQALYFNVSIYNVRGNEELKDKVLKNVKKKIAENFCQLDMVLLLKSGQILVFECKAGGMESENAKAREYTTYALGGAYGKPVLVTPLLKRDIPWKEDVEKIKANYDKQIYTIAAAYRAGLDVCFLDSLKMDIESIFKEVIES